ncbi:MAG: HAMP domain-containing sensor histidine kinase [Prolixibacteraceae bacterium]|nr:HAMP domain-containing sensor histidine kinase [Prolixibacteraceae bacterium]
MLIILVCVCVLTVFLYYFLRKISRFSQKLDEEKERNKKRKKENSALKRAVKTRTDNLEKALQKAEEANHLKSLFLANMSHEIRTPLNSIIGFSELIIDNQFDQQSKETFSKQIEHNSQHLLSLIDQIFHLSIIETGRIYINLQEVDVTNLFKKMENKTIALINHSQKEIEFKVKTKPEYVLYSDKTKLKLILENLLNNAIKFTESGSIELSCSRFNDTYLFQIKDTGCGIREDEYDIIFDPFAQGLETLKKIKGGSGLGLANVKNYVILLGGKVWCEKNEPVGSIFSFTLPIPSAACKSASKNRQYSLFKN